MFFEFLKDMTLIFVVSFFIIGFIGLYTYAFCELGRNYIMYWRTKDRRWLEKSVFDRYDPPEWIECEEWEILED